MSKLIFFDKLFIEHHISIVFTEKSKCMKKESMLEFYFNDVRH